MKKLAIVNEKIVIDIKDLDHNINEMIECGYYVGDYKKVNYKDVKEKIDELYYEQNEYYSSAMDILATYVKGQKLIYMESHLQWQILILSHLAVAMKYAYGLQKDYFL